MTKKQLPIKEKVRVNLLIADIYACEPIRCSQASKVYQELVEVVQPDGSVIEKLVERPYDITPEYVKSFEQSADYRLDPNGAVANAPKRNNLGDITAIQNISNMDSSALAELGQKMLAASKILAASKGKEKQNLQGDLNNGDET